MLLWCHYLLNIKKYRCENSSIRYLGKTWYDTQDIPANDSSGKSETKPPSNKGQVVVTNFMPDQKNIGFQLLYCYQQTT